MSPDPLQPYKSTTWHQRGEGPIPPPSHHVCLLAGGCTTPSPHYWRPQEHHLTCGLGSVPGSNHRPLLCQYTAATIRHWRENRPFLPVSQCAPPCRELHYPILQESSEAPARPWIGFLSRFYPPNPAPARMCSTLHSHEQCCFHCCAPPSALTCLDCQPPPRKGPLPS